MIWGIIVFAVYFFMLIAIAVAGTRRMRDISEYVLGGRRLSSITAALSAGSSTPSAWTMMALPALAFTNGAVPIWVPVAIVAGVWLSWALIASLLLWQRRVASIGLPAPAHRNDESPGPPHYPS